MKRVTLFAISLVVLVASRAQARQLPALVAKVYPGAVIQNTKAGKPAACGFGEDHHDAFCFLTKDPFGKVRAFYATEGVKLDSIPIGKDQNAANDGIYDLEEAVRLQLAREEIGSIFAGPVEYWRTRSSADEVSYFNSVIVMTGRTKDRLQRSAASNTAAILENPILRGFVLTPELAFMNESVDLLVDPARLVPLHNAHLALSGAYFKKEAGASTFDQLLGKARTKRGTDMITSAKPDPLKTQDNKTRAIDALLVELDKEAYPTLILIQRTRKDGVTRDPAAIQKEWKAAMRFLRGK